jgi:PAS domain-containing protein
VPQVRFPLRAVRLASRRDSPHLLEAALESAGIAMLACAADGRVTHVNRHARELLGVGCAALGTYPDTWMRRLRPRTASGIALPLEDLPPIRALHGEIVNSVDVLVELPGGETLLEAAARPANDHRGKRRGAIVTMADVTELRTVERRMRDPQWTPWGGSKEG